jgi:hypothetical protein
LKRWSVAFNRDFDRPGGRRSFAKRKTGQRYHTGY